MPSTGCHDLRAGEHRDRGASIAVSRASLESILPERFPDGVNLGLAAVGQGVEEVVRPLGPQRVGIAQRVPDARPCNTLPKFQGARLRGSQRHL